MLITKSAPASVLIHTIPHKRKKNTETEEQNKSIRISAPVHVPRPTSPINTVFVNSSPHSIVDESAVRETDSPYVSHIHHQKSPSPSLSPPKGEYAGPTVPVSR